ncbi:MaoC/PaaZ C-terminal domain-containing protein [Limibacillus sp. MBR-115]|jgi:acyl dehydratase|uniref:MaoC family dehydratase n=1 Tax=Limibacillus sp. MBR-115 TaxID=3156465 RepID=UPI00339A306C
MSDNDSILTFPIGKEITLTQKVSESDVINFADITGDKDPIHLDQEYAKSTLYGERIAHGALIIGYMSKASTLIHEGFGRPLVSLGYDRIRLIEPVFIDDIITIKYKVIDKDIDKSRTIANITVTNQRGNTVLVANHIQKII